jgi:hypothetical protein
MRVWSVLPDSAIGIGVVGGPQHRGCIIPQAVTHSLVLLKMGK